MAKERAKPLPFVKNNVMKGKGQNAAFAWKYQNIKRAGSTTRDERALDKIQDELQQSMRKTFQIFEKGVRHASIDPSSNRLEIQET